MNHLMEDEIVCFGGGGGDSVVAVGIVGSFSLRFKNEIGNYQRFSMMPSTVS